MDCHAG
jgi:hypothetical protein